MMKYFSTAIKVFVVLSVLCGGIYPLLITLFAQTALPYQANGSIIKNNDTIIGSDLIGQNFRRPDYFWGRPSAINYNPYPSGAYNLGPLSLQLKDMINSRIDTLKKYQTIYNIQDIPNDLLFASGSGVDPDISPEAAIFQIPRIAKYRHYGSVQIKKLYALVNSTIEKPQFEILGMPKVNVLKLNLKLNSL